MVCSINRLDQEVKSAMLAGTAVCIELDANSKLGPDIVPGDPDVKSRNGKLLEKVIDDNDLVVVNGTQLCTGLITRYRKTVNNIERSVIDFFIVCKRFFQLIMYMEIDEKRLYTLTKYSNKVGEKKVNESDHNIMILKIRSSWDTLVNEETKRMEIYNYMNEDDFKNFKESTENNEDLTGCFDDPNDDVEKAAGRWLSEVNNRLKRLG